MKNRYELSKLTPDAFEVLVNQIAMKVLGAGVSSFAPGPDGGRDGYFEGKANYPSDADQWEGVWYIQSKFHAPHLTKNSQDWLISQVQAEINDFADPDKERTWPDIMIFATNVNPSGGAKGGSFDKIKKIVAKARPGLEKRFVIWGERQICDFLDTHAQIKGTFSHFLTPGHILSELLEGLNSQYSNVDEVIRCLVYEDISEQRFTKLEQAGADPTTRPGIQDLFVDLPFKYEACQGDVEILRTLSKASSSCLKVPKKHSFDSSWRKWMKDPKRGRLMFIKGGPGQGKSTLSQYFSQIQRACLILNDGDGKCTPSIYDLAQDIRSIASKSNLWPMVPRIPVIVELREFAAWRSHRGSGEIIGLLSFLADQLTRRVESQVTVQLLKKCIAQKKWFFSFDGLDEVPSDLKDSVAQDVLKFFHDTVPALDADVLGVCTSRPQGYSDQFNELDGAEVELVDLPIEKALECARSVLKVDLSDKEFKKYFSILKAASANSNVRELMVSPLQSHIMAIIVKDGARPPDRKWNLYRTFYSVIKRREANRDLPNRELADLLSGNEQLIKGVHNRLGFVLHSRAEMSHGASTDLPREEFEQLVGEVVEEITEGDCEKVKRVLSEATRERLVLVSTPDDGENVRFDIRPLQEFFAAEYLYESVGTDGLSERIETLIGDAHWREVVHFLISALVEGQRNAEIDVAVQALVGSDDSKGDSYLEGQYYQCAAHGLLIVVKLLSEGVLEQDKRIRDKFKGLVKSVASFYEPASISDLWIIKHTNTKTWLINLLFDTIYSLQRSEYYASIALLVTIVEETDARIDELKKVVAELSIDSIDNVLNFWASISYRHHIRRFPQAWFRNYVARFYLVENWKLLTVKRVRFVFYMIDRKNLASPFGEGLTEKPVFSEKEFAMLDWMFFDSRPRGFELRVEDLGPVHANIPTVSWAGDPWKPCEWWSDECFRESKGLLEVGYCICRYGLDRTYDNYVRLEELILKLGTGLKSVLGEEAKRLFPIVLKGNPRKGRSIKTLSQTEHEQLLSERTVEGEQVEYPGISYSLGEDCTKEQWQHLLDERLALSVDLYVHRREYWNRGPDDGIPGFFEEDDCKEALFESLGSAKGVLDVDLAVWGRLIKEAGNYEPQIRAMMKSSCEERDVVVSGFINESEPFPLLLPDEIDILPFVAYSLLCRTDRIGIKEGFQDELKNDSLVYLNGFAIEDAVDVSIDVEFSIRVLSIVLSKGEAIDADLLKLGSLIAQDSEGWKWKCVCRVAVLYGSGNERVWREFFGGLFKVARYSFELRSRLHRVLSSWRERSGFPITKGGFEMEWLKSS